VGPFDTVRLTFSSLILEDSCCNLVTTDVILLDCKYDINNASVLVTYSSCKLCPSLSSSQCPRLSLFLCNTAGMLAEFASRDDGLLRLPIRLAFPLSTPLTALGDPYGLARQL